MAAERTRRARPVRFSVSTGLRLCGMAELPFWPGVKCSSASRTSVRWRWRTSVASRSMDEAMTASVQKKAAWRSRGITCVDTGSTASPRAAATWASMSGSTLAKVPTGPEMAQVAISARAATRRARARWNSAWKPASFSPNVVGSAWMPWLRPMVGVSRCSNARRSSAPRSRSMPPNNRSAARVS